MGSLVIALEHIQHAMVRCEKCSRVCALPHVPLRNHPDDDDEEAAVPAAAAAAEEAEEVDVEADAEEGLWCQARLSTQGTCQHTYSTYCAYTREGLEHKECRLRRLRK